MKKGFILGTVLGIVLGGTTMALAANSYIQAVLNQEIKVSLDGEVQEFRDETTNEIQYPLTYHDRTYLPLRTVANLVGVEVDYDANNNTAILMTQEYVKKQEAYDLSEFTRELLERASYANFLNNLGEVRTVMLTITTTVKGEEAANGIARSDAQCYHFVARGGALLDGEERENLWLSRTEANKIGYTKINDNALSDDGFSLPAIEVSSRNGEKQNASYFVTSNGYLFIWPPYEYQNEFYVNDETKVTKADGTTIKADNNSTDVANMLKAGFSFKVGNTDVTM